MENTLRTYHSILFLELRPYQHRDKAQAYFKKLFAEQEPVRYHHQPLWDVHFLPPYTDKLKYYHRLIVNEATSFYNELGYLIKQASDDEEKEYHLFVAMQKLVSEKLKQTAAEINRLDYRLPYILPGSDYRLKNPVHAEESFIFQLMKVYLTALYLNIQDGFGQHSHTNKYDITDIYFIWFGEQKSEPSFLKKAETIVTPVVPAAVKDKRAFNAVKDDITSGVRTKLDYSFIRNPERFADIETRLYEYEIIDVDYHFIRSKKQSNHTLLAAVYRELIDKNYFRRNILKSKEKIKDIHIREYLDARYFVNTSQQFRKLKETDRNQARLKLPWLEKVVKIP